MWHGRLNVPHPARAPPVSRGGLRGLGVQGLAGHNGLVALGGLHHPHHLEPALLQRLGHVQRQKVLHVRLRLLVDGRHKGRGQQDLQVLLVQVQDGVQPPGLQRAVGLGEERLGNPQRALVVHQADGHQVELVGGLPRGLGRRVLQRHLVPQGAQRAALLLADGQLVGAHVHAQEVGLGPLLLAHVHAQPRAAPLVHHLPGLVLLEDGVHVVDPVLAHLHVAVRAAVEQRRDHQLGPEVLLFGRVPAEVAVGVGVDGRVVVVGDGQLGVRQVRLHLFELSIGIIKFFQCLLPGNAHFFSLFNRLRPVHSEKNIMEKRNVHHGVKNFVRKGVCDALRLLAGGFHSCGLER
mmetsp:Transcript_18206/g.25032  ORF Transcript_18206/g.25032 Transcript_18206/m.25032 type:complete len:349 (-) Transcript_18206:149-1195(-)